MKLQGLPDVCVLVHVWAVLVGGRGDGAVEERQWLLQGRGRGPWRRSAFVTHAAIITITFPIFGFALFTFCKLARYLAFCSVVVLIELRTHTP